MEITVPLHDYLSKEIIGQYILAGKERIRGQTEILQVMQTEADGSRLWLSTSTCITVTARSY